MVTNTRQHEFLSTVTTRYVLPVVLAVAGAVSWTATAAAVPAGAAPRPVASRTPPHHPEASRVSDVAFQADAAHDGDLAGATLPAAAIPLWRLHLGRSVSYPLVVGGRVFVTVAVRHERGPLLEALAITTGTALWHPLKLGGSVARATIAYGGGRVLALGAGGRLEAVAVATGKRVWSVELGPQSFTSPPAVEGAAVYVDGSGRAASGRKPAVPSAVYAVSLRNGAVRWKAPAPAGGLGSPALGATRLYVSGACGSTDALKTRTGKLAWAAALECPGHAAAAVARRGSTVVLHGATLDVLPSGASGFVLSAATGARRGSFASSTSPAFAGALELVVQRHRLVALVAATRAKRWRDSADAGIDTAPLVVGSAAVAASSSGTVCARTLRSGALVFCARAGAPIAAPDEQGTSSELAGLGAAGGVLVVPAGGWLVAFGAPRAPAVVPPVAGGTTPGAGQPNPSGGQTPGGGTTTTTLGASSTTTTEPAGGNPPPALPEAPAPILLVVLAVVITGAVLLTASRRRA